jgi:hypothetical protein
MRAILSLLILMLICTSSFAGSKASGKALFEAEEVKSFAKQVEYFAAEKGARAFIIARAGRPEKDMPRGITFTHVAIAVYSDIHLQDGEVVQGYAIHNLYQNAKRPNRSDLVTDYPVDFFWGAQALKAGILIPTADLQQKLIELIASGDAKALHNPKYSVIANPFNTKFQNCTEYTLDVVNSAIYDTLDMQKLKVNAKAHFAPQRVHTSRFKLALGAMFMNEVSTADHKGKIYTTTFTSIGHYLRRNGLAQDFVVFEDEQELITL